MRGLVCPHPVAVGEVALRKVETLSFAKPSEVVVPLVVGPLLVGIIIRAVPDLDDGAIRVISLLDVETFVIESSDGLVNRIEGPLLSGGVDTVLDGDHSTVGVRGCREALVLTLHFRARPERTRIESTYCC